MVTASELPIDTSASAMDMAEAMFGSGINIISASYTGDSRASGIYSNGDSVAPDLTPSDSGVILSTGEAQDVTNSWGDANNSASTGTNLRDPGDSDLDKLSGVKTYDAAVFEAEFVPDGDTLTMQVVFSSEEYLEYVNSGFNDAVGIWVNGVKAELTVGTGDITINNINDESNSNLYVDNPQSLDLYNTEMDGFTVTLTLKADVNAGEVNDIKIAIADGGDAKYDSNLLIAGDSIQCALIAGDDIITVEGDSGTFDLLANDTSTTGATLTITKINGQNVHAGDTITLPSGEEVTLNADGTVTIHPDGDDETNTFTYEVTDSDGNTDTAFVKMTTVPCLVAGTLVDTPNGPVAVEDLKPGDLVLTEDNGAQPIRWCGRATRRAEGRDAPVVIEAGALGDHGRVELSQNHRVMLRSLRAELMFGESEILVKAKDLLNDQTIRLRRDNSAVTYVHLLFEKHQIIRGNGLESESYHPGDETLDSFDAETRDELLRLMPAVAEHGPEAYGPAARLPLKSYESKALLAD
ncbi:choice-of-anchor L domain-containing protein [Pseudodonghicola flavimaris]|uniref:Choice-of-anchor L domain-containing protein n=1 Tax=Pseudodonghicola flavimaris TaxID=3050036 RepID=A0ABT7EZ95_9RHOB|nr:choice-of-anchor L domain-containing protein [Pseudodonghicola flavimaris]MDK3017676.1 choice-of-anchor L domain-containing protein [Pseudodonghicola flavimaris]